MEPKFQTSFIPKKQIFPAVNGIGGSFAQKPKVHGASLFMAIAVIIFILSIGAVAGVYFWKSYLTTANEKYKTELAVKEKDFNLRSIEDLKKINSQIDLAKKLLKDHVATSKIFEILGKLTLEKVRFTSLDFKSPTTPNGPFSVSMKGYGANLPAVAYQSDVLSKLSELSLSNTIKNAVLSDPALDANGAVSFGFTAEVNAQSMSYHVDSASSTNP